MQDRTTHNSVGLVFAAGVMAGIAIGVLIPNTIESALAAGSIVAPLKEPKVTTRKVCNVIGGDMTCGTQTCTEDPYTGLETCGPVVYPGKKRK